MNLLMQGLSINQWKRTYNNEADEKIIFRLLFILNDKIKKPVRLMYALI